MCKLMLGTLLFFLAAFTVQTAESIVIYIGFGAMLISFGIDEIFDHKDKDGKSDKK